MREMIAVILFCFFAPLTHAQSQPAERGLIVFLNMYTADGSAFLNAWFKAETEHARKMILKKTKSAYGRTLLVVRDQTRLSNLIAAIRSLDSDPKIRAIDMIVYTHGSPTALKLINEPGRSKELASWVHIQDVTEPVFWLQSKKLRAMYSDSCYSAGHADEWLQAGFKTMAGSIGIDSNQDRDLARFLDKWVQGATFESSIDAANREPTTPVMDRFNSDGNSRKRYSGNGAITILTPVL